MKNQYDNDNPEILTLDDEVEILDESSDGTTNQGEIEVLAKPRNKRKNNKSSWLFIVFAVVFVISAFYFANSGMSVTNNNLDKANESKNIDTGTTWGNKYANRLLDEKNDFTYYDVAFVDLDFDKSPEMLFKYLDSANKECLKVMYINNSEVMVTKEFRTFTVHLIYSLKNKDFDWYIKIATSSKYGAYTKLNKIVDGTAYDSDIKVTNDTELVNYNKTYVDTNYELKFYRVNKDTFEKDFTTIVNKFNNYNNKVNNVISDVSYEYKDYVFVDDTDFVDGLKYKLNYGKYIEENNRDSVILINKDSTITLNEQNTKFEVVDNTLLLEDGSVISVISNNKIYFNNLIFVLE